MFLAACSCFKCMRGPGTGRHDAFNRKMNSMTPTLKGVCFYCREHSKKRFSCSADRGKKRQPCPVDPSSAESVHQEYLRNTSSVDSGSHFSGELAPRRLANLLTSHEGVMAKCMSDTKTRGRFVTSNSSFACMILVRAIRKSPLLLGVD